MYDFFGLNLQDLFRIKDACLMLATYNFHNHDLLKDVSKEINKRVDLQDEKTFHPLHPDDKR